MPASSMFLLLALSFLLVTLPHVIAAPVGRNHPPTLDSAWLSGGAFPDGPEYNSPNEFGIPSPVRNQMSSSGSVDFIPFPPQVDHHSTPIWSQPQQDQYIPNMKWASYPNDFIEQIYPDKSHFLPRGTNQGLQETMNLHNEEAPYSHNYMHEQSSSHQFPPPTEFEHHNSLQNSQSTYESQPILTRGPFPMRHFDTAGSSQDTSTPTTDFATNAQVHHFVPHAKPLWMSRPRGWGKRKESLEELEGATEEALKLKRKRESAQLREAKLAKLAELLQLPPYAVNSLREYQQFMDADDHRTPRDFANHIYATLDTRCVRGTKRDSLKSLAHYLEIPADAIPSVEDYANFMQIETNTKAAYITKVMAQYLQEKMSNGTYPLRSYRRRNRYSSVQEQYHRARVGFSRQDQIRPLQLHSQVSSGSLHSVYAPDHPVQSPVMPERVQSSTHL